MKDLMTRLMALIMDYEQQRQKSRTKAQKQQTPAIPLPATNWSKFETPTILRNKGATRAFFL